jgi:hypothetical protein
MIDSSFHREVNYALIKVTGANSLEGLKHVTDKFRKYRLFSRHVYRVYDFSLADLTSLNSLDFLRYVAFLRHLPISKRCKTALVAAKRGGLLLMFVNQMIKMDKNMFADLEYELNWVSLDNSSLNKAVHSSLDIKYHQVQGKFTMQPEIDLQKTWFRDVNFSPSCPLI